MNLFQQFCLPSFHFQRVLRYEIRVSVALGRVRNPLTHATNASLIGGRTLAKERGSHGTHLRFGASYTRIAFDNSLDQALLRSKEDVLIEVLLKELEALLSPFTSKMKEYTSESRR